MDYTKWLDQYYSHLSPDEVTDVLGPELIGLINHLCMGSVQYPGECDLGDGSVIVTEHTIIDFPCRYVLIGHAVIAVPCAKTRPVYSHSPSPFGRLSAVRDQRVWAQRNSFDGSLE